jgi:hypothetical protein
MAAERTGPAGDTSGTTEGIPMVARLGAWMGLVGPLLFVLVITIEGWARPEYRSSEMFVSAPCVSG